VRVLVVSVRPIWPPRDGGTVRTYNLARQLTRRADVVALALDLKSGRGVRTEHSAGPPGDYTVLGLPRSRVAKLPILARTYLTSRRPFAPLQFQSAEFTRLIRETVARREVDILQIEGIIAAAVIPPELLHGGSRPAIVLDAMDVEHERLRRQAQVQSSPVARLFYGCEARRMRAWEQMTARRCDGILAVSDHDAETLRQMAPDVPVALAPNGADLEHYRLTDQPRNPASMLYVGVMDYPPNRDAVQWFCADILPRIQREVPLAQLDIVGRNGDTLGGDVARARGVEAFGLVDDVQPHYAGCGVFVVPLRSGGGTRLKIAEALACGCAVVSTSIGAEGLPVTDGEHLVLADRPEDFAAAVVGLIKDPARAAELGRRGAELVRRSLGWDAVAEGVTAFYETLVRSR
jgi:polysaccharide biosynthesis protein PslH